MPLFFHDTCLFGDEAGWGQLLQEHQYEHSQFVQIGRAQTPVVFVPDYDLASWQASPNFARNWLTSHFEVHQFLRSATGVSGVNLADVDLSKEDEFYEWLDDHRNEHAELRIALGITS